jgi:hypothetical protein
MAAYARLQQSEFELEKLHGYRAIKHQRFVGAGYFDTITQTITAGQSSLVAMHGSTEDQQFRQDTPDFVEAERHHASDPPDKGRPPRELLNNLPPEAAAS